MCMPFGALVPCRLRLKCLRSNLRSEQFVQNQLKRFQYTQKNTVH